MDANILTKEQIALLKYIGASDSVKERFYLTGGTPLTAFYLGHRYSEDLDFFYICRSKGYTVSDLIKKARIKFDWHIDPIQLGTQFVKAQEAEDMPHMIQEIRKEEWRKFFIEEAKRLSHEVIE